MTSVLLLLLLLSTVIINIITILLLLLVLARHSTVSSSKFFPAWDSVSQQCRSFKGIILKPLNYGYSIVLRIICRI